jgi:molybdopterin synthase sulfur carrier subunit
MRCRGRQLELNHMPTVKLYANLRNLAGTKELFIAGGTVGSVVSELARQKPPISEIVLQNGGLAPHVIVNLNGHNIKDFETPVAEQDIIAIFPPIAGG